MQGDANTTIFMPLRIGSIGSALSHAYGMLVSSWRSLGRLFCIFTPFIRSSSQRNPALGFLWWWIVGHLRPTTKNAALALPFSPEEVGRAIAEMKASSTPESDDLHVTFFQKFWMQLQWVIMPMLHEFYIGALDMSRVNFGVITLILKIVGRRTSDTLGRSR